MEHSDAEGETPTAREMPDGSPFAPPASGQPTTPVPIDLPAQTEQTPVTGPPPPVTPPPGGTLPPPMGPIPVMRGTAPVWGTASPTPAPPAKKTTSGGWRWAVVAVVAALLGSVVGGSIVNAANHNNSTTSVKQISAGPALLNGTTNIESVIAKVLPAVVSIDAKTPQPSSQGNFGQPQGAATQEDQGTGMIISSGGEVVTNNHVISGATVITVTLYGQHKAMPATLVDTDPTNDVALLQITGASNLPTVNFENSDNVQVGDAVVAIGNALGLSAGTPTVTQIG